MNKKIHRYFLLALIISSLYSLPRFYKTSAQAGPTDPVVYWKMESTNGTSIVDSSGNGRDLFLTLPPSPQLSPDTNLLINETNNNSLAFDGVGYSYAYPIPETVGAQHLTVEAWVKFDGYVPYDKALISTFLQQYGQWMITTPQGSHVSPNPNEIMVWLGVDNWSVTNGANIQPNIWNHIAFVYDGTGATNTDRLKIYINGVSKTLNFHYDVPTVLSSVLIPVRVGKHAAVGLSGIQGKLDEIRIYTYSRSDAEIAADYNGLTAQTFPSPTPSPSPLPVPGNPIAYWKMEETNGDVVVDSAGNGHDLLLTDNPASPSWSTTDKPQLLDTNNSSLEYDGIGYTYAFPIPETAGSSHLTIEGWAKFNNPYLNSLPIMTADENFNFQWSLILADINRSPMPNELQFYFGYLWANGPDGVTVGANLQPNTWYHYAVVFDGTGQTDNDRLKVYINGRNYPLAFVNGSVPATLGYSNPPLRIGRLLQGKLDDIRIYNTSRSSTDIISDYSGQTAPIYPAPSPTPSPLPIPGNPITYWKMNEQAGYSIIDSSGNGHTLNLPNNQESPVIFPNAPTLSETNDYSLYFDGNDDYAYTPAFSELSGSSHFTYESWIKFDNIAQNAVKAIVGSNPYYQQWGISTGDAAVAPVSNEIEVWFPLYSNNAGITVGANLQTNYWYHIAVIYNGNNQAYSDRLKIFINGKEYPIAFRGSIPSALDYSTPEFRLGKAYTTLFTGKLDEVRIYNIARSSTDILNDANGAVFTPYNTPVGNNVNLTLSNTSPNTTANLTFNNVSVAGNTVMTVSEGGQPPPSGFKIGSPPTYYTLNTTAIFDVVEICIDYTNTSANTGRNSENNLKLMHFDNGVWVDVTTSLDTVNNIICGLTTSFSEFAVMERNDPPVVGVISAPVDPQVVGTTINVSTTFTDINDTDTHTALWNWGDGATSTGSVSEAEGSGTVTGTHIYTTPGVYIVSVVVSDDLGANTSAVYEYIVVYDPEGGFVTGGGGILSPAGAYTPNPSFTGDAHFGFVSKYQNGTSVPTGQTQFRFQLADLKFKSTEYQWLVVSGPQAKYKGSGTINGNGNYGFLLAGTDGQVNGGGGTDKFRIKIWDKDNNDTVVYDNQLGASENADPTTVLTQGQIQIQN